MKIGRRLPAGQGCRGGGRRGDRDRAVFFLVGKACEFRAVLTFDTKKRRGAAWDWLAFALEGLDVEVMLG